MDKVINAAVDFFRCDEADLNEVCFIKGTVYKGGGFDYHVVYSADHTDTECVVYYRHMDDSVAVSRLPY